MTADFEATISSSVSRAGDLFNDEPVVGGAARSVRAVPVLEYDATEALHDQCLAPGAEATCHVRRQADVDAGDQQALEMPFALEQRDLQERLAIDLEQVEGREDLPRARVARERVAIWVELELRFIAPIRDEDAVDDRGRAVRLGHDRVVQLARSVNLAVIPDEVRPAVADTSERPLSLPIGLQDVTRQLRAFAGVAGSLRREIRAQNGLQLFPSIPPS